MGEVASGGRTVLFVSHNMAALQRICRSGIWFDGGKLQEQGATGTVVGRYLMASSPSGQRFTARRRQNGFFIDSITVLDPVTLKEKTASTWSSVNFRVRFYSPKRINNASVVFQIQSCAGDLLFFSSSKPDCNVGVQFEPGFNYIDVCFERLLLSAGTYVLGAGLAIPNAEWLLYEPHGMRIDVLPADVFDSGQAPTVQRNGVAMPHRWLPRDPRDLDAASTPAGVEPSCSAAV